MSEYSTRRHCLTTLKERKGIGWLGQNGLEESNGVLALLVS